MNELVTLNENNIPTTTSLLVADHFNKQHKHVMRDIRNIINTLEDQDISIGSRFGLKDRMVPVGYGEKKMPVYEMDRKGFMLLVMGFTGDEAMKFKNDFVDAFDAMEAEIKRQQFGGFQIPQSYSAALLLAAKTQEKVEQLECLREEDRPKVEFYDDQ